MICNLSASCLSYCDCVEPSSFSPPLRFDGSVCSSCFCLNRAAHSSLCCLSAAICILLFLYFSFSHSYTASNPNLPPLTYLDPRKILHAGHNGPSTSVNPYALPHGMCKHYNALGTPPFCCMNCPSITSRLLESAT